MAKKSSKATKGEAAASKAAAAAASARGASSSHASAFSPPLHGASSSSGSTPPSPLRGAVSASPPSPFLIPLLEASSSSSSPGPMATGSPALLVTPGGSRAAIGDGRMRSVEKHILDLQDHDLRENALAELSKRVAFQDLAPLLWFSFGTIAILLQDVLSIYPMLSPPSLTPAQSNRVCNALALLQCVASHPDTRILFAKARMPFYLYSFLSTIGESRPFEHLRLATLGVIGALVKVPNTKVIIFLLSSEIMPLCLRAMESGSEMSRTVATFVVQRLLQDDVGLHYVCYLPERLFAVCQALRNVVASLADKPSVRLLKQVIRCYLRLLDDERSLWALRNSFPKRLSDGTFDHCLHEDQIARIWLQRLLDNVQEPPITQEVNWPAVNRYAARVCPRDHRTEKILEFGTMCRDLINSYFQLNKVKPKKIVVFRDGVSEGQFDMVPNEELSDLKSAVCDDNYQPTITLVVAQKGHQTRLFLENVRDGGATGNVPPGTVVDTKIVHPFEFDFYLCSHYGRIGTSKAVHYCVLWDENSFTSDQLQKIIYNLCFTFARSTRPVSLVPPVYYADLVAYRGRIFQEAAKEFQSRSLPPSKSTIFDQSFYNLHPDLQNIMFFV